MIFIEITKFDAFKRTAKAMINLNDIKNVFINGSGDTMITSTIDQFIVLESYDQIKSKLKMYGYFLDVNVDECKQS